MSLPQITGWFHLGADPECGRLSEGGIWRATFSAAANKKYENRAGNEVKATTWLRFVAWREVAHQVALAELHKGSFIWVRGELVQERYTDDHGEETERFEVAVFEFHLPPPRVPRPGGNAGQVMGDQPRSAPHAAPGATG